MSNRISTWLVWLGVTVQWLAVIAVKIFLNALGIAFTLAILTIIMLSLAEQYNYKVVPEIDQHQYERRADEGSPFDR